MKSEKRIEKFGKQIGQVLLFAVLFATMALVSVGCAATIYVPDDFPAIQQAVNNATEGDRIIVRDGTYNENVDVDVSHLAIISENGYDSTFVQAANTSDPVFNVSADYVNISGFSVTGATGWDLRSDMAGISLSRFVANCIISDNNVTGNGYGIYLDSWSKNNTLTNNIANSNSNYGVFLGTWSKNNTLINNTASLNILKGIYLYASSQNTLVNNIANLNKGDGIFVYAIPSKNNTFTNNTANTNSNCGIHLGFCKNNTLTNNTANSNSNYGVYLQSSSNNCIYNNYFNNTNNAYDDGNNTWNITKTVGTNILGGPYIGGNYWSDYTGADSDGDGLGDTQIPYNSLGNIQSGGDWRPAACNVTPSAPALYDTNAGTYAQKQGHS